MSSDLRQALSALLVTVAALGAMDYYFWGEVPDAQALVVHPAREPQGTPLRGPIGPPLAALKACSGLDDVPAVDGRASCGANVQAAGRAVAAHAGRIIAADDDASAHQR